MSSKYWQFMSVMALIFWLCLDALEIHHLKFVQKTQRQVNESQFQINEVQKVINKNVLADLGVEFQSITITNLSGATVYVRFPGVPKNLRLEVK